MSNDFVDEQARMPAEGIEIDGANNEPALRPRVGQRHDREALRSVTLSGGQRQYADTDTGFDQSRHGIEATQSYAVIDTAAEPSGMAGEMRVERTCVQAYERFIQEVRERYRVVCRQWVTRWN
jgi:hypothetical protein